MWIADLVALRFEDWNGFLRLAGVRVHVQLLLARLENVRRLDDDDACADFAGKKVPGSFRMLLQGRRDAISREM
jgi:hypothetical protein